MATQIRSYTLDIPAGTTAAAPAVLPIVFPPAEVQTVQVVVPPGPSGLVGWQIQCSGVPVIPYLSDQWIVTAGEFITWPLDDYPTSGSWSVAGYNTGGQDHSVYFRFLLGPVTTPPAVQPAMIDDSQLNAYGGLLTSTG